jgi:hypothetical protein
MVSSRVRFATSLIYGNTEADMRNESAGLTSLFAREPTVDGSGACGFADD